MDVIGANGRPKRWAREALPVRVAIGMWIIQGLVGPLYLALPGVSQRHAAAVFACSAVAIAWAAMNLALPNDPRLTVLYPLGGALAIAIVSILVAATGGADSPLRASQLFSVVFAAWFMPRGSSERFLAAAVAATLLPLLYDGQALTGASLGWTIMLTLTLLITGLTIVAARAKLEAVRDRARAESLRDPLTGIANRRGLETHVGRIERQRREHDGMGIVLIDLDCFKQVNTLYGHAGGDRVLTAVADALLDTAREGDLAARIGGDEFAIVVSDADVDRLSAFGERAVHGVRSALREVGLANDLLGASAGVAAYPQDGSNLDELLNAAGLALAVAKAHGKGHTRCASHTAGAERAPALLVSHG